jgi:wobble nucleotide-excising tRNase
VIHRLQLLRNIGLFDSVNSAATLPLGRLSLIYAENGRGKTTLAAILRSLSTGDPVPIAERKRLAAQNPPHVVVECDGGPPPAMFQNNAWNRTVANMAVFDDVFVDQNIYSGLVVEPEHRQNLHELILGSHGVSFARNLQALAERMGAHNSEIRDKGAAIPAAERGSLSVDDFCALTNVLHIDEAIQAAERRLNAVREQDAIRMMALFDPIVWPAFDVAGVQAILNTDLPSLDGAALTEVQTHLQRLGEGGENWVAAGMRSSAALNAAGDRACPFCAQQLDGSALVTHYRGYFSEAYTALKRQIAETQSSVTRSHGGETLAEFERAVRLTVERRQFWSRFTTLPEVAIDTAAVARDWVAAREAISTALRSKQAAPLERMLLSPIAMEALAAFEARGAAVRELSSALGHAVAAIRVVKEGSAAGNASAILSDLARLKAIKARFALTTATLCNEYLAEKDARAATEALHRQARQALDQHREAVFPAYQTAINTYLLRFNAGFRLHSVTSANPGGRPSCNYSLVINGVQGTPVTVGVGNPPAGTPTFKNTLSAGDRNTLALAFFFASLDLAPNLADMIVVIDDPMTSLDEARSLTTAQEVRALAARANQVIVLSHDKRFLCKTWEHAPRPDCATLTVTRDQSGSTIAAWLISEDCITDYDRQHARLRNYTRANTGNSRQVAQDLRHVLEGFLRRACPEHFLPGEVLGELRRRIRNRQPAATEILAAPRVAELDAISEYANKYHHETNAAWETEEINDLELRGWTHRTLAFVSR